MKKIFLTAVGFMTALVALAQYQPTSTWPYVYEDFVDGTIHMSLGNDKTAKLNVHVLHGALHFIEGDMIKEAAPGEVFSAQIGKDVYINAGGKMLKILAKNENGYVAEGQEVDIVKLNSSGAAYGSSSATLGNMSLSSLDGIGGTRSNMNHMDIKANKDNGQTLPLIGKVYVVANSKVIYATRKDVSENVDAAAFKAFLKENKVKWNDPVSLLSVVDFIANQK